MRWRALRLCLAGGRRSSGGGSATPQASVANPFFAFDNGTGYGRVSPEEQAAMLKELGYDGIGYTGAQQIPAMLKALDAGA